MTSSLPKLPKEALVHIFAFLGRSDVKKARSVCKTWRDSVDSPEFWMTRCCALELLPTAGVGVLKTLADKTRAMAEKTGSVAKSTRELRAMVSKLYREHYLTWKGHTFAASASLST